MTKDILVRISGLHQEPDGETAETDEVIEVIVPGIYYYKNKKQYILYEEIGENGETTKNQVKIYEDKHIEVRKSGALTATLVFETGCKHGTAYQTPFGLMQMTTDTRAIELEEAEDIIGIGIDYSLEVNREPVADCRIEISITPRQGQ